MQEEAARRGRGLEVLLEPEEGVGISVCVEDVDAVDIEEVEEVTEDWAYGEMAPSRTRWKPAPAAMIPTAMPPVSISA